MRLLGILTFLFLSMNLAMAQRGPRGGGHHGGGYGNQMGSKRVLMDKAQMLLSGSQRFTGYIEDYLHRTNSYFDSRYQNSMEMKAFFKVNAFEGAAYAFLKVVYFSGRDMDSKMAIINAFRELQMDARDLHSNLDMLSRAKGLFHASNHLYKEVIKCANFVDGELAQAVYNFTGRRGHYRGGSYRGGSYRGGSRGGAW